MIRLYLSLLFLSFAFLLHAQITVSSAGFPKAGDTLSTRIDITPMISFDASPGMNDWTFDGLSSPALVETVFQGPESGSSTYFGSADMVSIPDAGTEYYYRSTDSSFTELGYYGVDPIAGIVMVNAHYSEPLMLRRAPLNYADVHQQQTELLVPISSEIIPDTILNMLPVQPDSLRLRVGIMRNDTVNAYGTLSLNEVDFEVLQEKRVEERSVFFDAKVPFFGWQDITPIIEDQFPGFGAGAQDTIVSYYYFSEGVKEPIAVVNVDDRDTPQRVEFKELMMTSSSSAFDIEDIAITASPNPSIGLVEFRISNAPIGKYKIKVRNIIGQTLWEKQLFAQGSESLKVDLTNFKRGTYFYTLIDEDGNTLVTKRLVFIRA